MTYNFDHVKPRRHTNSEKWTHYPEDVLPFWVADMDFTAPPAILEALNQAISHGVFGYESLTMRLKEIIIGRMHKLYGWKVDPQAVIATPGIVSAFNAAAVSICNPGEGYLIQPPVYMPFNYLQQYHGFIRQEAPLICRRIEKRMNYEIDWDVFSTGFHSRDTQTRMFLLCNPHNPTGQVYSRDELTRMAEICLKNGSVIVSDEIHSELLLGSSKHTPIASLSPEIEYQTITLIAPSKTFNVPGLYCGFAIIPNPDLRSRYKKAIERLSLHVNSLGLIAAQSAFSGDCDEWLLELRHCLTSNRNFVAHYLGDNIPDLLTTFPDATYLMWFDFSGLNISDPYKFLLKHANVALNDGAAFGTGGSGFVRFNFGTSRSLVAEGLGRIKRAIDENSID